MGNNAASLPTDAELRICLHSCAITRTGPICYLPLPSSVSGTAWSYAPISSITTKPCSPLLREQPENVKASRPLPSY